MLLAHVDPDHYAYAPRDFTHAQFQHVANVTAERRVLTAVHCRTPAAPAAYGGSTQSRDNCWDLLEARCGAQRCEAAKHALANEWAECIDGDAQLSPYRHSDLSSSIVVHVRGGDAENRVHHPALFVALGWLCDTLTDEVTSIVFAVEDKQVLKPLKEKVAALAKKHPHVTVRSVVGGDPVASWFAFVDAGVLVLGESSYSVSASIVRDGRPTVVLGSATPIGGRYDVNTFPCHLELAAKAGAEHEAWWALEHGIADGGADCSVSKLRQSVGRSHSAVAATTAATTTTAMAAATAATTTTMTTTTTTVTTTTTTTTATVAKGPGGALASQVMACNATAGWPKRYTDVFVSIPHKFVFVDNVKAGSTVIRTLFKKLHPPASWYGNYTHESISNHTACHVYHQNVQPQRVTTGCLSGPALVRQGFLIFSFVRSPLAKFLSGAAEASEQMGHKPAAKLVEAQIARGEKNEVGSWVNEHFESNLWRVLGLDIHGDVMPIMFIGRLEHFSRDWRTVVDLIPHLSKADKAMLLKPLPHLNSRPTPDLDDRTKRKVCKLPSMKADIACLGYGVANEPEHGCEGLLGSALSGE